MDRLKSPINSAILHCLQYCSSNNSEYCDQNVNFAKKKKSNFIMCRERSCRAEHNLRQDYLYFLAHDFVRRRILHSTKHGGFQVYLRPVRLPGQYSCLLDNTDINNSLYVVLDNGKNKRFTVRDLKFKNKENYSFFS